MLEKMKERSIDNFMGRVLVKLVELQKTGNDEPRDVESHIQTLSCSSNLMSRFSPEEVRAVHFQPLMAARVRFLKITLEAVISGIEEMEKKTGEMPDNLKQKMGMGYDSEIDSDSPEDMRKFLIEVLGSTMRSLHYPLTFLFTF